jgi:hypothetical protein
MSVIETEERKALRDEGSKAPSEEGRNSVEASSWKMSSSIAELVTALAKAQLMFKPIHKKDTNPAYHAKYSGLPTVIAATQTALAENGLVVMQLTRSQFGEDDAKMITITTMLAHSSGQWIATDLTLPAMMRERFDSQAVGSAVTYGRRYGLQAILGVAADEDDDGNKAAGIGSKEAVKEVIGKKLKEMAGNEPVTIVDWKEGILALTGNGLAIVRNEMTAADKEKVTVKWNASDRVWSIPEAQGNMFASLAEKYGVKVVWKHDSAA